MSAAVDFRAMLTAHAPLVALVGQRIAQGAVPEGTGYPLVVYTVATQYERGLDGTVHGTTHTIHATSWGNTPDSAEAVADAVDAAVLAANPAHDILVSDRANDFDPDLGLDGVAQTVEWIVT